MEEGYVVVNQISTRIITIGGWIDQPLSNNQLVIIIPGNPGLIGYYEKFAISLHEKLEGNFVVWGIGHGGHELPSGVDLPCIKKHPNLFTLEGQIEHKIDFISKYVPSGVKLHLIGHSIGAKISVELVNHYLNDYDVSAYLLFPTLERMAQTPKGQRLALLLGPGSFRSSIRSAVVLLASVINKFPESWLISLLHWVLRVNKNLMIDEASPTIDVNVRTTLKLLQPEALERCLFMAHNELQVVGELNAEAIRKISDRLILYFGTNDHWCPLDYFDNFKRQVPEARAIVCPHQLEHAFVLNSSHHMASIVSEWLREKL